ncbi:MAG: nucleotidyltransferase family protein, partial [Fusobacteriaceae bacterium]|nr:nucleotidyltransferase family protein [Fusobacteriaceae bacterium]
MKACGIIVEYNPFHNGHKYHLEKARELTGAEVVIACMSGNFLQRGEPSLFNKWVKTEMALLNGVDLVVELPTFYSNDSAEFFAKGSIRILDLLKVDNIVFGSEVDNIN